VNAKAKGTRNEHRSMRLLESAGYACCRSAASLGAWDIVAIGSQDVILLQVKSNRWPCPAEMEVLKNFACPMNCRRLVHVWRDRARLPITKEL